MPMDKLPIWAPVTTGYKDALNACNAMRGLAVYAALIALLGNAAGAVMPVRELDNLALSLGLGFVMNAAQNFLLTPIMIAVHRFILLEEVTSNYVLEPRRPTFRAFFGWLMALSVLSLLVSSLVSIAPLPSFALAGLFMAGTIFIVVVSIRLAILFPAIAVDAPGATPANAWADSNGHGWRIFIIFALAAVPLFLIVLLLAKPFGLDTQHFGGKTVLMTAVSAITEAFFVVLSVAIASRLFQALADRLVR